MHDGVPEAYRGLICSCWSQLPEDRPSLDQIVSDQRNKQGFITEINDESEFYDNEDFNNNWKTTFYSKNQLIHFEDFIKSKEKNKLIRKVSFNTFDYQIITEKTKTKGKEESQRKRLFCNNSWNK